MSDEDQETTYKGQDLVEELYQNTSTNSVIDVGNISDELKPKKRLHKTLGELRHPRQKFCPRWQIEFPWLKPNRANESIGYCNICKRELVCKKSHLERHQRSFKHMRLQGFENVFTVNEPEADLIEAHTSGYLDNGTDQDYQIEEVMDELDDDYSEIKIEPARVSSISCPVIGKSNNLKKSPPKTRTTIKSERGQLSSMQHISLERPRNSPSYYGRSEDYYYSAPSPPKRDSFDLFFDSISATVKTLPPKLAAEVKSKVSQVIAEFELRAICEKEAQENAKQSFISMPTQVASVLTVDSSVNTSDEHHTADGVTHYVYTYPQKMNE